LKQWTSRHSYPIDRENNTAGISILLKTLIENTIDIKYARYFYEKSSLETISSVIDDSEFSMFGKDLRIKLMRYLIALI
jgi:hypothetical protein